MLLLAGDIGGTKTNLAVFSPENGPRVPLIEATFPSANYPSLEAVVQKFFAEINLNQPVERAVFGVAGPVIEGRATITNLPWIMSEFQLAETLKFTSVNLLNDLAAIASGVPFLEPTDLQTLNQGQVVPGGSMIVIAPGTGLGEAYLTWDGSRYRAHASEGGHTDFAPTNELEIGLLQFLQQRFAHVSYERVCSGIGLPNIYAYLKASGYAPEPDWLALELAQAKDATPIIVNAALDQNTPCEICRATLDLFISILGTEAGNMALKIMATGGVYLGGGIPPRILPLLLKGPFMASFQNKGRFSEILQKIPVHIILNPKVALLGTASYGLGL